MNIDQIKDNLALYKQKDQMDTMFIGQHVLEIDSLLKEIKRLKLENKELRLLNEICYYSSNIERVLEAQRELAEVRKEKFSLKESFNQSEEVF